MAQKNLQSDAEQAGDHVDGAGLSSFQNLTPRQQEVFDLLVAYINQHGYPPTVQELAGLIGVSSQNAVTLHLRALHKKNFIKLSRGVSRGISVVGKRSHYLPCSCCRK
ncbi:LexA DNA binding domain-containing protein [Klebsiella grimontii]|uniref:LexA DNA binding domain-containing protein n=1 Tax=Klebsiella grimontii TaxID=2058152 RepID=A0A7H4P5A0_9ENTR|nr:LexA DNA binding domain-containing protein [Klebsiella grimontii]